MAAPVMRTVGFVTGFAGTTTKTINLPTHAAGETLYIALVDDAPSQVFTIPADWSRVINSESIFPTDIVSTFLLIKKVAGGSEPASIDITVTTSERSVWIAFAVQGDNGFDAVYTSNAGATSVTAQVPAITTTVADILVVSFVGTDSVTTPHGTPSTYSRLAEVSYASGGSLSVNYQTVASPTTVAAQNSSMSISEQYRGWAIAIKPVSGTTYTQSLSGSLTPSGTLAKRTNRTLVGGLTPTGTVNKRSNKSVAGSMTPAGTLLKRIGLALSGSIVPTGSLTALKLKLVVLGGSVSSIGSLHKVTIKVLDGTLTPTGNIIRSTLRRMSGTVTLSGMLTAQKFILKVLSGTVGVSGALRSSAFKRLVGTIAPIGEVIKRTFKRLGGTIGISGTAGNLRIEAVERHLPRGTIYSTNKLSFQVEAPPWTANQLGLDLTQDVTSYDHTSAAIGGFWTANISVHLPLSELVDWVTNGVGRQITVRGRAKTVAWEGIVNRVSLDVGGFNLVVGPYTDICNKVKLSYSLFLQLGGGQATGIRVETAYLHNLVSQAKYGILEKNFSAGGINEEAVNELQAMLLARYAFPPRSEDLTLPGGGTQTHVDIKLECIGYAHLFEKYAYNSATSSLQNLSSKVAAIVAAEPNGLFSSIVTTNTLQVAAWENDSKAAWGLLKDLVAMGDVSLNRYTLGIYEDRKVLYKPVVPEIVYIRPLREGSSVIQDAQGGLLQPWQVRPGVYLLATDLIPGKPLASGFDEDLRVVFVETVQYRMPDGLLINGSHFFKVEQRLGQLGISGIG